MNVKPGAEAVATWAAVDQESQEKIRIDFFEIFPRVDPNWVNARIARDGWGLIQLVDYAANPVNNVPKVERKMWKGSAHGTKRTETETAKAGPSKPKIPRNYNYLNDWTDCPNDKDYILAARKLLAADFPQVCVMYLHQALRLHRNNYAPTWKVLHDAFRANPHVGHGEVMNNVNIPADQHKQKLGLQKPILTLLKLLKKPRAVRYPALPDSLSQELDWLRKHAFDSQPQSEHLFWNFGGVPAKNSNGGAFAAPEASYECGICCNEVPITEFIACEEGHLFCKECVCSQASEIAFGNVPHAQVNCLEADCNKRFDLADLKMVIDSDVWQKLEERHLEENICTIGDLERCKYCNWGAVLEVAVETDKVFRCENCKAQLCRQCGLDWDDDHIGIPCKDMETDIHARARHEYEEKMAMTVIRKCHRCGVAINKVDGCNKMTCRCKATMCYVCRAPNISYNHFCQHPREEGKCNKCTRCFLWEDAAVRDKERLEQIQRERQQDKRHLDQAQEDGQRDEQHLEEMQKEGQQDKQQLEQVQEEGQRHEQQLEQVQEEGQRDEQQLEQVQEEGQRDEQQLEQVQEEGQRDEQQLEQVQEEGQRDEQQLEQVQEEGQRDEQQLEQVQEEGQRDEQQLEQVQEEGQQDEQQLEQVQEEGQRDEQQLEQMQNERQQNDRLDTCRQA